MSRAMRRRRVRAGATPVEWPVLLPTGAVAAARGAYITYDSGKYQGRPFNAADYSSFVPVTTGAELTTALAAMTGGTCIVVSGTGTFTTVEGFVIPRLATRGAIVSTAIRNGSGPVASGTRVQPANESTMPKIRVTGNGAASCFRFLGPGATGGGQTGALRDGNLGNITIAGLVLEDDATNSASICALDAVSFTDSVAVSPTYGEPVYTSAANEPHDIVWDRCIIKSNAADTLSNTLGANVGLWRVGRRNAIHDCHVYGFRGGSEPKALLDGPGQGDHWADNCLFEGVAINYMVGGYSVTTADLRPDDIVFRRCHFVKRLGYLNESRCKNLYEIKNAQRVLLDGCVLENSRQVAQVHAIVLFSVNQDNLNVAADIHYSRDVTLRYCLVKNVDVVITLGRGASSPFPGDAVYGTGTPFHRAYLQHVAAEGGSYNTTIRLSLIGVNDVTVDHCTFVRKGAGSSSPFVDFDGATGLTGLVVRDTITEGFWRTTTANGAVATLAAATTAPVILNNLIANDTGATPATCISVASSAAIGFTNKDANNYALTGASPGRNAATDGTDIGIDAAGLATLTAGCTTGVWG